MGQDLWAVWGCGIDGECIKRQNDMLGWFNKKRKDTLDQGLSKTRTSLFSKISKLFGLRKSVDEEFLDNLEEVLVGADVGVETTIRIIDGVEAKVKGGAPASTEEDLHKVLHEVVKDLLSVSPAKPIGEPIPGTPYVVLVVGVNGVGKTTTIGKLAYLYKEMGKTVMLGAADTFRAAAIDQLTVWSERVGVPIVKQKMGADPASVAYDTVAAAMAQGTDVVLIDTAGRLHNKVNLMNELGKIRRVMQKLLPDAPQEVLLVLDGSTGQNAYEQAKQFVSVTEVNALALTKLDGTAKGGVAIGITDQLQIPIKYIGVGEQKEDLQFFDKDAFVDSLFL